MLGVLAAANVVYCDRRVGRAREDAVQDLLFVWLVDGRYALRRLRWRHLAGYQETCVS